MTDTTRVPDRQRVLIADDDAMIRSVVRSLLVKLGRDVDGASDTDETLRKLQSQPYDLVILDLKMPPHGGLHVCAALQKDPAYVGVPIVILTASDDPLTRARCQDAGARLFATKPFTPATLVQSLRPVLRLDSAEIRMLSAIIGNDRGIRVQDVSRRVQEVVRRQEVGVSG